MNDKCAFSLSRTGRPTLIPGALLAWILVLFLIVLPVHAGAQTTAHFSYARVTLGSGFLYPAGVTVDKSGAVFVADQGNWAVKEIPLVAGVYAAPVSLGSGFSEPYGVAVDASGNVFVGDTYNSAVKEIPSGCAAASCMQTLGGGFSYPAGVSVDAIGIVFVADWNNNLVKEIPPGCTSASCV